MLRFLAQAAAPGGSGELAGSLEASAVAGGVSTALCSATVSVITRGGALDIEGGTSFHQRTCAY